ncbi:MAG TPA: hypothetical protein VF190_09885, partial [Rhodothermales bacterium]
MIRSVAFAVILIAAAGLVSDARAQEPSPTIADVNYTAAAPAIDGVYDAAWDASLVYPFTDSVGHRWGAYIANPEYTEGPDDFSGHLRALWDET